MLLAGDRIRDLADEAGVGPVRPHDLHHTCLATQNDRTGDLRAVQAFAGHSKPETTSGYTRARDEALKKLSEALDYLGDRLDRIVYSDGYGHAAG